jgi:hypothetical protein
MVNSHSSEVCRNEGDVGTPMLEYPLLADSRRPAGAASRMRDAKRRSLAAGPLGRSSTGGSGSG